MDNELGATPSHILMLLILGIGILMFIFIIFDPYMGAWNEMAVVNGASESTADFVYNTQWRWIVPFGIVISAIFSSIVSAQRED